MRILRSPRWRRRLVKIAVPLVLAAPLIYLGVHYSNPGNPGNATGPNVAETGYYTVPKKARFTAADQEAVHHVLRRFIISAVARHDVKRSWDVSGPDLRQGYTRKQWTAAGIPVVPYPAASRGLGKWDYVEYSFKNDVGLEVFLFPKPGSGYSAMTADAEVVKGHDGKWRVNYWMPKKFHGPPAIAAATKHRVRKAIAHTRPRKRPAHTTQAHTTTSAAEPAMPATLEEHRPSKLWWAVPLGVLALLILVPVGAATVIWLRNRRAEREYLRSSGRA
jgi:hypothetical protein